MKTVFFDIEAGGLKSNVDQILCAAFKPYGKRPYVIDRELAGENDKKLACLIRDELKKYDHVVTYYGLDFDMPFISGRLLKYGLTPMPRKLHTDCYRLAKKIFKWTVVSKRLVYLCEHLGIAGKTRVDFALWEEMKYASVKDRQAALAEAVDHCRWDVITLEKAYEKCFKHAIVSISMG